MPDGEQSTAPAARSFGDILDAARPAETTAPVCLRGDLVAEVEDLERQLAEATIQAQPGMLTGNAIARRLAEQIEARRAEMVAATATFRFRALPRADFTAMIAAHPPRKNHEGDKNLGINQATFWDALLRVSVVEPVMTDSQYERLANVILTDGQFDKLATTAWNLNRRDVDVPFSYAASRTLQTSEPG